MEGRRYWRIRFESRRPDDDSAILISEGAEGACITGTHGFECFLSATEAEQREFLAFATSLGASLLSCEPVEEKNWTASCDDVWEHVRAGLFKVVPVQGKALVPELDKSPEYPIFIIPGMGFGTGQHSTTRLVLQMLQGEEIKAKNIRRILDVGTGSGILAIAASRYFAADVAAFDIDPHAIRNAVENSRLNGAAIDLFTGDLCCVRGEFDLITANIYAEVLLEMEPLLRERLATDGILILSGIREEKEDLLRYSYAEKGWQLLRRECDEGWIGLTWRQISQPAGAATFR